MSGEPGEFGGDLDVARTRARRWPWLVPVLLLLVTALKYGLTAAVQMISFESTDDSTYTSWVLSPVAAGDLEAAALLGATGVVLCLRRWSPRARTAILAGVVMAALTCVLLGAGASNPRRHLGSNLLAAVALVPAPADAVMLRPAQLGDGGGSSDGTLSMPAAGRSWTLPTTSTWQADCALMAQQFVGSPGWQPRGPCSYGRIFGRVIVTVYLDSPGLGRSPDTEVVVAEPNIFGGL